MNKVDCNWVHNLPTGGGESAAYISKDKPLPPEKWRSSMKIVVVKSPRFLAPILRLIFKMKKDPVA